MNQGELGIEKHPVAKNSKVEKKRTVIENSNKFVGLVKRGAIVGINSEVNFIATMVGISHSSQPLARDYHGKKFIAPEN